MVNERFGFSTGALEKGDYKSAIGWLRQHDLRSVELSALRYEELEPLVGELDTLTLHEFTYISFHAPSSFLKEQEDRVVSLLGAVHRRGWNIIVHPDVIFSPNRWRHFGHQLLVENMDRRKSTGRTVEELRVLLSDLPNARLCLDVAHARQLDTTLLLLAKMATFFKGRIAEVHISELDSRCRHQPLSWQAISDYRNFAAILHEIPVIIESMLHRYDTKLRQQEIRWARAAMEESGDGN